MHVTRLLLCPEAQNCRSLSCMNGFELIRSPRANFSSYVVISLLPHLRPKHPEKLWDFFVPVEFAQQKEVVLFRLSEEPVAPLSIQIVLVADKRGENAIATWG